MDKQDIIKCMHVTKHAQSRIKERLGLNKGASINHAIKAFTEGERIPSKEANKCLVFRYNLYIYIFQKNNYFKNYALITVYKERSQKDDSEARAKHKVYVAGRKRRANRTRSRRSGR